MGVGQAERGGQGQAEVERGGQQVYGGGGGGQPLPEQAVEGREMEGQAERGE